MLVVKNVWCLFVVGCLFDEEEEGQEEEEQERALRQRKQGPNLKGVVKNHT